MKLGEVATVCRTKNAGAFLLTLDLVFANPADYSYVCERLSGTHIADLYRVPEDTVRIVRWDDVYAIKITVPRWGGAGEPGDRDVYGCQQHAPLLELVL